MSIGVGPYLPLIIAAVLVLLAALAFAMRMRRFEANVAILIRHVDDVRNEQKARGKEKGSKDELAQLRQEIKDGFESLRSRIGNIPAETSRLIGSKPVERPRAAPAYDAYDPPPIEPEDGIGRLLTIANRIAQESSMTIESFRASAGSLGSRVSSYTNGTDNFPVAFIVEHRGSHYAVPNVMKPARLPKEWFNRSEFGVNDEIQRVISLPRLRRRGNEYDVQEPGVFA
jgi:hypothetical protein